MRTESGEHGHRTEFALEFLGSLWQASLSRAAVTILRKDEGRAIISSVFHKTADQTCFGFVWAVDLA